MKVIKEGYSYGLHNVENSHLKGQVIQFIEIEQDGKLVKTVENGTSLEDLLEVALAKARHSDDYDKNSREKAVVATKVEEAILWLRRHREVNKK